MTTINTEHADDINTRLFKPRRVDPRRLLERVVERIFSKRPLEELNPMTQLTEHARSLACVNELHRKRLVHAVDIINTENTDECAHHLSVRAVRTAPRAVHILSPTS